MLARISNARATRDADFTTRKTESPDEAVSALETLLALDMGDFCKFELVRGEELMDENGYSKPLKRMGLMTLLIKRIAAFVKKVESPDTYQSFEAASLLASKLFDPVFDGTDACFRWDYKDFSWCEEASV